MDLGVSRNVDAIVGQAYPKVDFGVDPAYSVKRMHALMAHTANIAFQELQKERVGNAVWTETIAWFADTSKQLNPYTFGNICDMLNMNHEIGMNAARKIIKIRRDHETQKQLTNITNLVDNSHTSKIILYRTADNDFAHTRIPVYAQRKDDLLSLFTLVKGKFNVAAFNNPSYMPYSVRDERVGFLTTSFTDEPVDKLLEKHFEKLDDLVEKTESNVFSPTWLGKYGRRLSMFYQEH